MDPYNFLFKIDFNNFPSNKYTENQNKSNIKIDIIYVFLGRHFVFVDKIIF